MKSRYLLAILIILLLIPANAFPGGAKRVTGTSVSTASNHGLKPLASDAVPVTSDDGEWYPFVLPEKLDQNSPMNIGKLVLDPPAGKHGFVKVKLVTGTSVPVTQAHFYFEDGTRAKFWGTNLCFGANFPTHKEAEWMADRLAFFGFNAVRLHHMDFYFEPRGIFKDVAPAYKDPQMKETGHLSEKQLDRLDYLIYQLKQRGIYVDVNLLVSRHFTEADGVKNAEKLGMAAKPASMFDPRLIKLQEKYAKDLLTHYNPYTKLRYCDDPVVALVEVTNENSLIDAWKNGKFDRNNKNALPNEYLKQIEAKWQEWPKSNLIFTNEDWKKFFISLTQTFLNEMKSFLNAECGVKVPVTGIGGYWQADDVEAQADMDFIDTHAYWDHPTFPHKPWDMNDFRIHNKSILKDPDLGIIGIIKKKQETINNRLKTKKPFTVTEWNHCYPNKYAYESPILLASKAHNDDWDGLFQFAFSHGWEFAPSFDNIRSFFDILPNSQQLILDSIASWLYLSSEPPTLTMKNDYYLVSTPSLSAAAGFIKGKKITLGPFTFAPSENGAVILISKDNKPFEQSKEFLIITVGEIRNKNSGWDKNGKFQWAQDPVMIKKIRLDGLSLQYGKPASINEEQNQSWHVIRLP